MKQIETLKDISIDAKTRKAIQDVARKWIQGLDNNPLGPLINDIFFMEEEQTIIWIKHFFNLE